MITAAFGTNLLFYIIITPILTTTLMKLAYAGEPQMQVIDGLKRMGDVDEQTVIKRDNPTDRFQKTVPSLSGCNRYTKGQEKMQSIIFH